MNIVTIDFETHYDKEYSLSKMTVEEYVRDDRFEAIGVGIKFVDTPAIWQHGANIVSELESIEWDSTIAVAHNAIFDASILSWKYGIKPAMWIDTLALARAIDGLDVSNSLKAAAERHGLGVKGEEVVAAMGKRLKDFSYIDLVRYGLYCCNDCELTYALLNVYIEAHHANVQFGRQAIVAPRRPAPNAALLKEIQAISLTVKMFSEPVLELDLPLLEQHMEELNSKKEDLLNTFPDTVDVLKSNPKFAALLESYGVNPPMKISPLTGKSTYAFAKTDSELLALQEHEDDRVSIAVSARLGVRSSIAETRTQRFIDIAKRGTLPVPLKYYAAHTGRWGGTDKINLHNLPSRGGNMTLRHAIRAPKGHVIIDCDSAQIEVRVLAWLAGEQKLLDSFLAKEDVYRVMARRVYGYAVDAPVTDAERFMGKTLVLGCGYGVGAVRFHTQLLLSAAKDSEMPTLSECREYIYAYRKFFSKIPKLWREANDSLQYIRDNVIAKVGPLVAYGKAGFLLPSGYSLKYPGLTEDDGDYSYKSRTGKTKIYGGKVVENLTQALARCVISEQMVAVAERYRPVLTVHDSIAIVVPVKETDAATEYLEKCMSTAPDWAPGLPLSCKSKIGETYGG